MNCFGMRDEWLNKLQLRYGAPSFAPTALHSTRADAAPQWDVQDPWKLKGELFGVPVG